MAKKKKVYILRQHNRNQYMSSPITKQLTPLSKWNAREYDAIYLISVKAELRLS